MPRKKSKKSNKKPSNHKRMHQSPQQLIARDLHKWLQEKEPSKSSIKLSVLRKFVELWLRSFEISQWSHVMGLNHSYDKAVLLEAVESLAGQQIVEPIVDVALNELKQCEAKLGEKKNIDDERLALINEKAIVPLLESFLAERELNSLLKNLSDLHQNLTRCSLRLANATKRKDKDRLKDMLDALYVTKDYIMKLFSNKMLDTAFQKMKHKVFAVMASTFAKPLTSEGLTELKIDSLSVQYFLDDGICGHHYFANPDERLLHITCSRFDQFNYESVADLGQNKEASEAIAQPCSLLACRLISRRKDGSICNQRGREDSIALKQVAYIYLSRQIIYKNLGLAIFFIMKKPPLYVKSMMDLIFNFTCVIRVSLKRC